MATDPAHRAAADRKRRIILEYDAYDPGELLGTDFDRWLEFRFGLVDQPGSQIDAIMWELHPGSDAVPYPSDLLPFPGLNSLKVWQDQGIDWLERVIAETRRRGLEVWWTHRISEVDLDADSNLMVAKRAPLKAAHPDWTIKSWWWQGMFNLAVPELRAHKVGLLRELAERYDFDGIQISYARHLPVLPVGRQWELREGPTALMRQMRGALDEGATARGRPILLGAKVPETVAGCRTDGLDVCTWAGEGLVDLLTVGSRTFTMDIAAFRQELTDAAASADRTPKLYPCYDDHHASDAYRHAPLPVVRGIVGNWLAQGADGVVTFNWSNAPPEMYRDRQIPLINLSEAHAPAYLEMGEQATLEGKDATFVTERRGVFPWSEGFFCKNEQFALPLSLANDGRESQVETRVDADVAAAAQLDLSIVVHGMQPDDKVGVRLNGTELSLRERDDAHKDPQIFTPDPQPPAGRAQSKGANPEQRLTLLVYPIDGGDMRGGVNEVELWADRTGPYPIGADLQVEKVEISVRF